MFDFPEIPKIIYTNTFLRSCIFNIEFSEKINWAAHSSNIQAVFSHEFPIKNNKLNIDISFNQKDRLNIQHDANAFELTTLDNQVVLAFENNILAIVFHSKSYRSFSTFEDVFSKINNELLVSGRELSKYSIYKISERKINLIDFKIQEGNSLSIVKQLINSQLVGNIDYVPNPNFVKQSINSINFEERKTNLNINYGYNKINESIGQVILDIVLFLNLEDSENLNESFKKINDTIFKAFNWAITEEYKNLMNG